MEYRTIDFGMEDCHLILTLPEQGSVLELDAYSNVSMISKVDVFLLDAEGPLDMKHLSYRTRPKVTKRLAADVQVTTGGDTLLHRFFCPTAALYAFEITCADESDCFLDVWSSQNTTYGECILSMRPLTYLPAHHRYVFPL